MTGSGSDPEDGTLGAAAFTWEVVFHHDTHVHPASGPISGLTYLVYQIPNTGHTESKCVLTGSPSRYGHRLARRIRVSEMSAARREYRPGNHTTGPEVTLDGQPTAAPMTTAGVTGVIRPVGVVSPQTIGADTDDFASCQMAARRTQHHDARDCDGLTATFQRRATGRTAAPRPRRASARTGAAEPLPIRTSPGGGANAPTSYVLEAGFARVRSH